MKSSGFSLIELVMVMAVFAVLLGLGVSSFSTTIASGRTRATAEAMLAGLQLARAEAIRRNSPMRFQIVSNLDSTCASATNTAMWVVTQTDQVSKGVVAGLCHAQPWTPTDQPDPCNPAPTNRGVSVPAVACASDPWIAYKAEGLGSVSVVTVAAQKSRTDTDGASIVTFGPTGQVLTNIGGAAANPTLGFILVTHTTVNDAKRWAVLINTTNGGLKMCDPDSAAGQPMACA